MTLEQMERALRADAAKAVAEFCAELSALSQSAGDWCAFALLIVQSLARVGVDEDTVLRFLDQIGPLQGFEEEWRRARIEVLRELEIHRATAPGVYNATAIEEVASELAASGVERRAAYRFALDQARLAGLALRGPRLTLTSESREILRTVIRP